MSNSNDLIEISGCDNSSRCGDVIFVHGLGGSARGTWHPQERQDDDNFWPKWLGEDFPDVGIWSLDYEVEAFKWKGNSMPLADRATNVLDLLDSYEIGDRPIIFITHSLGGLLVKQMLRNGKDFGKWSAIANKTKGIVFLSTPHSGSDMASWIKYVGGILRTTVSVEELEAHHPNLRNLNLFYRNDEQFSQIPMLVYCETLATKGVLVVNQTSADPGIRGIIPVPMDCDHISVCKVEDRKSQVYRQVKRFIQNNLISSQEIDGKEVGISYKDSFLDRLAWVYHNSQGRGLAFLDHDDKDELQDVISSADQVRNHDFTEFELEILKLVVSYCCFYKRKLTAPWNKFKKFKERDYYSEMKKLIESERSIRYGDICLSSLVNDDNLSQLLKRIE